tara:strand:+ start:2526 stop:3140 length:615 start_codon:yes stop_codon:yes gene_type:complete
MTTQKSLSPVPVLTARGSRIPKMGTLAYHPNIGFAEVVGRVGNRVRIAITDFSEATDVVLNAGKKNETILSRKHWLKRVANASDNSALIECNVYEARAQDESDALYGANALVKQLQESVISRCRRANEMLVNIDVAEGLDWEFDEYAEYIPKRKITKGKAPAPRPQPKPVSRVGTLEDASKPDWLVAEMNECFGNYWGGDKPSA